MHIFNLNNILYQIISTSNNIKQFRILKDIIDEYEYVIKIDEHIDNIYKIFIYNINKMESYILIMDIIHKESYYIFKETKIYIKG